MKHEYGASVTKIRELCARKEGVSLLEAAAIMKQTRNYVGVYLNTLTKAGELLKAGRYGAFRYFKDPADAADHDTVIAQEKKVRDAAQAKKKNAAKSRRQKEKRAAEKLAKGLQNVNLAKKDSALPKNRTTGISLITKQRELEQKREHLAANIEWPAHVKVQVIPTYQDNRFKPAPGHKGAFLAEWKEKRAA